MCVCICAFVCVCAGNKHHLSLLMPALDTRSGLHRRETSIGSVMFPCPALRETGSVNSEQPPLSLDPHQFIFVPFAHRYEPCACHEQTTAAERCSGSYVCVYTQYMYVCIYSFVYV